MEIHINNVDISSIVDWPNVNLTQVLTKEISKLQFNIKIYNGRTIPKLGDKADLTVNGAEYHYFGGTVTEVNITNQGGLLLVANITATDYSFNLQKKLIAKNYADMDPGDIVKDIVANYSTGLTVNHVQSAGFLLPTIKFNYESPLKAIQKLATLIGWDWNVDANADVHFFLTENNPAPFGVDDSSGNQEWPTLDWTQDLTNMKNSVYVIGANYPKTFTATTTRDVYTSDGVASTFSIAYAYSKSTIVVTLAGVSQTIGVDQQDDPSLYQVMYNETQRWIHFNSVPGSGHTVKVYGDAKIPILANASDTSAIALYGEIQDSIVDKLITTVPEALLRAQAEIALYGHTVNVLKFTTLKPGLFVGQHIVFNSPIFQAVFGTASISLTIRRLVASGYSPLQLQYRLECYGSDVVSFVDIMALLLQQENKQNPVDDNTVLQTLLNIPEGVIISDVALTSTQTGPYKWGADANQFTWGKFSWS